MSTFKDQLLTKHRRQNNVQKTEKILYIFFNVKVKLQLTEYGERSGEGKVERRA